MHAKLPNVHCTMCKQFAGKIKMESFGHIRFKKGLISYCVKKTLLCHQHSLNHSPQAFITLIHLPNFNPFTIHSHRLFNGWSFIYMITFGNYEFPSSSPDPAITVNRIWYVGFAHRLTQNKGSVLTT
jgi:hypothetical protein